MDISHAASDPGFEPEGHRRWLDQVESLLKGDEFERRLVSRSYDGLRIAPLYPPGRGASQPWRASHGRWRVAQRVDHPIIAEARGLALKDLEGGADALTVVASTSASARGFGLPLRTADDLGDALSGVLLDGVEVRLDGGTNGMELAGFLVALAEGRGHPPGEMAFDFGIDPLGDALVSGWLSHGSTDLPDLISNFRRRGFSKRILLCNGRPHHEAGCSEAQELAGVLATGLAYLRQLEASGHGLPVAREALSFLLVADADQFLTTAKFRALRRLWTRIEDLCGLDRQPIHLHAETSWRMKTRRDPWVNMLRETVAVMSAGVGGADTVTALPFTSALGLPDAFARRVARNAQLILLDEAHLWRVSDPAAGSGGIEALTEALCEEAWRLVSDIEGGGGLPDSIAAGTWQRLVEGTRRARERAAATLLAPITGTSSFPDLSERPVAVLRPSPGVRAGPLGTREPGDARRIEPMPARRTSEDFEHLRDRADAMLSGSGARPAVFIACLGSRADFSTRAAFAKNLFEAGGITASVRTIADAAEVAQAFLASGADATCLCSSDALYRAPAEDAAGPGETALEEASRALERVGCERTYVAGDPAALAAAARSAGIVDVVGAGCDAVDILNEFFGILEKAHQSSRQG